MKKTQVYNLRIFMSWQKIFDQRSVINNKFIELKINKSEKPKQRLKTI